MTLTDLLKTVAVAAVLTSNISVVHAEGTFFRPTKPTVLPPTETKQPEPVPGGTSGAAVAFPDVLSGIPQVVDTATLIVDGHRILLQGLEGLTGQYAQSLQAFISGDAGGNSVTCTLIDAGPYYRCVTAAQHVDVADAALLNGAAKANSSATSAQRLKEAQARDARRGIWAN